MAGVEVDGVRLPRLVADHPALDFCNTVAGWGQTDPFDYLTDYAVLARLVQHLGLVDRPDANLLTAWAAESPAAAAQVLRRVRGLRAATYAIVTSADHPGDWGVVARAVRSAVVAGTLAPGQASLATWTYDVHAVGLPTPLHLLAQRVSDLLSAQPPMRVGRCPGHDCGWVFVNRGNRRWCVMANCGNREKVRRHAARRASPPDGGRDRAVARRR